MKKVLVVEEDAVTARRMGAFWDQAGFQTRIVSNRNRAAFEACQFLPDFITLNMEGKEGEGLEVLRQLLSRPQTSRTPVVLFAGKEKAGVAQEAFPSVRIVMNKPLRFDHILDRLKDANKHVVG